MSRPIRRIGFNKQRLSRGIERLHKLGPRVVCEFVSEGIFDDQEMQETLERLDRFGQIDPR